MWIGYRFDDLSARPHLNQLLVKFETLRLLTFKPSSCTPKLTLPLLSALHRLPIMRTSCLAAGPRSSVARTLSGWCDEVAQRRVQSCKVVIIDPVHHLFQSLASCDEPPAVQPADLQPSPQTLCGRVVPAVALADHGSFHRVTLDRRMKLTPAVPTRWLTKAA